MQEWLQLPCVISGSISDWSGGSSAYIGQDSQLRCHVLLQLQVLSTYLDARLPSSSSLLFTVSLLFAKRSLGVLEKKAPGKDLERRLLGPRASQACVLDQHFRQHADCSKQSGCERQPSNL